MRKEMTQQLREASFKERAVYAGGFNHAHYKVEQRRVWTGRLLVLIGVAMIGVSYLIDSRVGARTGRR